jgi:glutamate formiminotransferase / 5-formyltetrahydrofolate cyclo-ligase
MLACVVNVSEGRDRRVLSQVAAAARSTLLDLHRDPDHHRAVLTIAGPEPEVAGAARAIAAAAVAAIDIVSHRGVHPRFGAVDVVPFVPLAADGSAVDDPDLASAIAARDAFARWAGSALGLPCFLYGPERSLPEVRRTAFGSLDPDTGPARPHESAGACAVGARPPLLAYNLWLHGVDVAVAQRVAARLRGPDVRALGLDLASGVQVSCNLVRPLRTGPAAVYDDVVRLLAGEAPRGGADAPGIDHAELFGLAPMAVVRTAPSDRRCQLDLDESRTVEARLGS